MEPRYTLSSAHMTHDQHVDVIDTQPEDPASRVVRTFKNHDDAVLEAVRLNNDFAQQVRQMEKKGLRWTKAHKTWTWLRPYN